MAGQRAPAAGLVGLNHAEYKMREAMQSLQQEGAPVPLRQPASRAGRQIVRQHAVEVSACHMAEHLRTVWKAARGR